MGEWEIGDSVTHKSGKKGKIIDIKDGEVIKIQFEDNSSFIANIDVIGNSIVEFDDLHRKYRENEKLKSGEKNRLRILEEEKLKKKMLEERKRAEILEQVFNNEELLRNKLNDSSVVLGMYIEKELNRLAQLKENIEKTLCIRDGCKYNYGCPDYENNDVQDLYMYKYFFAYFLTYFYLYTRIELSNFLTEWRILSIGSGNSIDGAAARMVHEVKNYVGIDKVVWKNNLYGDTKLINKELKNVIFEDIEIEPNVIIFPKSIFEFERHELYNFMSRLIAGIKNTDKIICIFAFATKDGPSESEKRAVELAEEIIKKKFRMIFNWNSNNDEYLKERECIFDLVRGLRYSERYFKLNCAIECNKDCKKILNSMLTTQFARYKICGWERKQ